MTASLSICEFFLQRGGDQDAETEDLLEAIPGLNLGDGDAIFSEVSG